MITNTFRNHIIQELISTHGALSVEDIRLCVFKAEMRAAIAVTDFKEDSSAEEDLTIKLSRVLAQALESYRPNNENGGKIQGKSAFLNTCLRYRDANAHRDANADVRRINSCTCSFPVNSIGYGMSGKDYRDEKQALQDKAYEADSLKRRDKKGKRPSRKSSVTGKEIYCRVGERDCEAPDAPHINKPEGEKLNFYAEIDYKLVQEKINELSLEDNLIEIRHIYEQAPAYLPDEILPLLKEMEDNQGKLTRRKKEKAKKLLKKMLEPYLELKKW